MLCVGTVLGKCTRKAIVNFDGRHPPEKHDLTLVYSRPQNFTSLGLRVTSMLISPWVEKGTVFQEPKGPTSTSQFELSSIPATVKSLFNLSAFLTKRDEWAGSLEELLLDTPRGDDSPMHLPDPPKPAKPWTPAPPLEQDEDDSDGPVPQHCSREDGVCRGGGRESVSQRRRMEWVAQRLDVAAPEAELTHDAAHTWLSERWEHLMMRDDEIEGL